MRSISTRLVVFDTRSGRRSRRPAGRPVDVLVRHPARRRARTSTGRWPTARADHPARPKNRRGAEISDLYEGGIRDEMLKRVAAMKASGRAVS
ncbi:hypothetical protein [Streptomyces echinatus]|uniref:hypothetical protein n=1 Tax=Streptomyces echinatus TaxID=67293 RepID=UPI003CD05F6B